MGIVEFFQWQWSGYSQAHQNRTNLLIHLLAVPAFIVSAVCLVVAIAKLSPVAVVLSAAAMLASVALQVRGHKLEQSQPRPFKSRFDFVRRVVAEQFFTFPRFVLTGRWHKNFTANR
jgi:uncharacterized membrane protein YoaK (UPF0700 family)